MNNLTEYKKCRKSFEYFCKTYLKISNPVKGLIPFDLYNFQSRYISHLQKNRFTIAKKFRQGGFTTATTAFFFWRAIIFDEDCCIVSCNNRQSNWISDNINTFIKEMDNSNLFTVEKASNLLKKFKNAGSIFLATPDSNYRKKLDWLLLDESAFDRKASETWASFYPNIIQKGKCVIVSTPNGNSGWFHETYFYAEENINSFSIFKSDYTECPTFNEEKIKELKEDIGEKGFDQEYNQKFLEKKNINIQPSVNIAADLTDCNDFYVNVEKEPKLIFQESDTEFVEEDLDLRDKNSNIDFRDVSKAFPELESDKYCPIGHPNLNEEFDMSSENLAMFFESISQEHEEYKESAKYWKLQHEKSKQAQEEAESKIDGKFSAELLQMAGLISKNELKEIEVKSNTGKQDILNSINENSDFPKSMKLSFKDYLEVNGVPTLITTNSVKNAYMGLASLWDHDKAVDFI